MLRLFTLLTLTLITPSLPAQDTSRVTTVFERVIVRAGPGNTYQQVMVLGTGTQIEILERNYPGQWLKIMRPAAPDGIDIVGWVKTGFINLPDDLSFEDIPLNSELPDADTSAIPDKDIVRLYSSSIIPSISNEVIDIYKMGQEAGLHANVVTKLGDSNSASYNYLPPVVDADYNLGPYQFLADTVQFYGESFQTGSIAARVGMNAFSIFDPIWAEQDQCEANESPIQCEYRVTQPAIALIMFGPNDLKALNTEQYREQLSLIVEYSKRHGVIPILLTFSSNPKEDTWFQAVRFNLIILDVAEAYDVPVINLWSAARNLPHYGIGSDNIHLTAAGTNVELGKHESRYGIALQNLIVLTTLHELMLALKIEP